MGWQREVEEGRNAFRILAHLIMHTNGVSRNGSCFLGYIIESMIMKRIVAMYLHSSWGYLLHFIGPRSDTKISC